VHPNAKSPGGRRAPRPAIARLALRPAIALIAPALLFALSCGRGHPAPAREREEERGRGHPAPAGGAATAPHALDSPADSGNDADIEHALRIARAGAPSETAPVSAPAPDSTAIKNAWHDEVQGIDATLLTPKQHELFVRLANAERCTCGCGYTLAGCLASDMTCEISGASAAALLDSIRAGRITHARGVRERPRGN